MVVLRGFCEGDRSRGGSFEGTCDGSWSSCYVLSLSAVASLESCGVIRCELEHVAGQATSLYM